MSEQRQSLQAQVGYLTGKLEDMESRFKKLDDFLRRHMESEEIKIARIYKALALMGMVIVLQSAGLSLQKIFQLVLSVV